MSEKMPWRKRPRAKRSVLWGSTKEEFQNVCYKCSTLADILRLFNLHVGAGNYKTLKDRVKYDSIDISHITLGQNSRKGRHYKNTGKTPLSEILVENSTYSNRTALKRKLLINGLLENVCYVCKSPPMWRDKPLVLRLDHISGVSNDNRIENLRLVCPNCDSQSDTFCRGAKRRVS